MDRPIPSAPPQPDPPTATQGGGEGPAPAPTDKPAPAALRIPIGYLKGRGAGDRLLAMQQEFGPLFGGRRLHSHNETDHNFVVPHVKGSQFFPTDHPRAGQPAYRWEDRGDGVMIGYPADDDGANA